MELWFILFRHSRKSLQTKNAKSVIVLALVRNNCLRRHNIKPCLQRRSLLLDSLSCLDIILEKSERDSLLQVCLSQTILSEKYLLKVYVTGTVKRDLLSENKFSRKRLLKLTSRYWCSCELLRLKTCYPRGFRVAEHKSEVSFQKFKMAYPIWRIFFKFIRSA